MLDKITKSTRLGISAGINDIETICQNKISGKRFLNINHLSIGFRSGEQNKKIVNTLLKEAEISVSLHPVDINLSDVLDTKELDHIKELIDQFEPIYFEEDLGLWRHRNLFLGSHLLNPIMSKEAMDLTIENVNICKTILNIPIVIENPPIYWTEGDIDFWDYFLNIANQSDCLIAFDVGHFIGYCKSLNKGAYFPKEESAVWDKIITLHISGMKSWYWNGIPVWIDRHSETFNSHIESITAFCLKRLRSLYCVLLEMEGSSLETETKNIENVIKLLN